MTEEILQLTAPGGMSGEAGLVVRVFEPSSGAGKAPMVLYLHGFGSDQWGEKASFFRQSAIGRGLGFCSFDFQGHGRSGGSMVDLTLSRNLADVERVAQLLASRGYPQQILLGSSMGGFTSLWHAALHPERVLAGLCIAPALSLESNLRDWAGEEGMKSWREEGTIRVENEIGSWDLGWSFVTDLGRYPVSRLQQLCRRPFLIVQGRLDERVDWRQVMEFVAGCEFEDLELHLFADGDHRLVDRKDRLWQLMRDYLEFKALLPEEPKR
jgi:pimeloyl-ACP methyl ester carboxylesterase